MTEDAPNYATKPPISGEIWRGQAALDWVVAPEIPWIPQGGRPLVVARRKTDGQIRAWLGGVELSGAQDPELFYAIETRAASLINADQANGLDPAPTFSSKR